MKGVILLAFACALTVALLLCAVVLLMRKSLSNNKSLGLSVATVSVIAVSLAATYVTALICKKYGIIEKVGSADAWIGFAGAGMGGLITMLALYFTLKQNTEMNKKIRTLSMRPYVVCSITNLDGEGREVLVGDCVGDYGFIECRMRNISNNVANGIKIVDEYSSVKTEKGNCVRYDDMMDKFGISIYTVSMNEGTFLAPGEEYNWKTNFYVEADGRGYKWNDSAFAFRHTVVFEMTDIACFEKYTQRFDFEININVDVDNGLHLFLWNIGNSVPDYFNK